MKKKVLFVSVVCLFAVIASINVKKQDQTSSLIDIMLKAQASSENSCGNLSSAGCYEYADGSNSCFWNSDGAGNCKD